MNRKNPSDKDPQDDDASVDRLFELARRGEVQLDNLAEGEIFRLYDSLQDHEVAELQRAEEALLFLKTARSNIKVLADHASNNDATLGSFDSTQVDLLPNIPSGEKREASLPKTVGRFEIEKVLGQGGFARVFLARDPHLDRQVALKIPLPKSLADPAAKKRFQRESRAAAILSHPAIVPIYESGSVGVISYIAFGYCPGMNLGEWIAKHDKRISPSVAAAMVARLADAVEHAHQRGIIHRDLKPANILIEIEESESVDRSNPTTEIAERARIADFGLARFETQSDASITVDGAVVGTPAYMSPEQARGECDVAAASDIFSLGSIFYELLTGTSPFHRESHLATLKAIEADDPESPQRINGEVPKDLNAICLKCLSKSPKDRYQSAHELAADIRRWQQGLAIHARPMTRLEKVAVWSRRNPQLAAAMLFGFLSLAIGSGISTYQWRRAATNLALSEENGARASRHLDRSQEAINSMVSQVAGKLHNSPEFADLRKDLILKAVELQQGILADEGESSRVNLEMTLVLSRLVTLQNQLGHDELSLQTSERALSIIEDKLDDIGDNIDVQVAYDELRCTKATGLHRMGRTSEALALLNEMCHKPLSKSGLQDQRAIVLRARALYLSGKYTNLMGDQKEAIRLLESGIEHLKDFRSYEHECLGPECTEKDQQFAILDCRLHDTLGSYQLNVGDTENAEISIRKAIEIAQPLIDAVPGQTKLADDIAICRLNLAEVLIKREEHLQGVEQYRLGKATFFDLHRSMPAYPRYTSLCIGISKAIVETLIKAGDVAAAEEEAGELKAFIAELPVESKELREIAFPLSGAYAEVARACRREGNLTGAREWLDQSLSIMDKLIAHEALPGRIRHRAELLLEFAVIDRLEGHLLDATRQCTLACESFREGHEADKDNALVLPAMIGAYRELAEIHVENEEPRLASAVAEELVALLPENADALALRDEFPEAP